MSWNRNTPYIGPRRRIPVRRAPNIFDSPFFGYDEDFDPRWAQQRQQQREEPAPKPEQPQPQEQVVEEVTPAPEATQERPAPQADEVDWKARAMALQAEMENFRKRQTRRAEDAAVNERERLLRRVLPVADNLARALDHSDANEASLRRGVELIERELKRLLESEGVTRVETVGQPFDPNVHEAVGTQPAEAEPDTVVAEVEAGYKLGDKLLRPARVIVATG